MLLIYTHSPSQIYSLIHYKQMTELILIRRRQHPV